MRNKRVCIFAHFDKDDLIDEYVWYYLNELLTVVDKLVFVTVSKLDVGDQSRLGELNVEVIQRENVGYDFFSYKTGLENINLDGFDELIMCNDSVYGPLFPMKRIFDKMEYTKDVWGITESFEFAKHIQSYFIVYKKHVFQNSIFQKFWKELEVLHDKNEIIQRYEIGLSRMLLEQQFTLDAYVKYKIKGKLNLVAYVKKLLQAPWKILRLIVSPKKYLRALRSKDVNVSYTLWEKLILEYDMPFVKSLYFKMSPHREDDLKLLENTISKVSGYPFLLISKHIARVGNHYNDDFSEI